MQKIVTLASDDERRESVALGRSQRELGELLERHDELLRYRREYAASQPAGATVSAVHWQDRHAFLARLDQAVSAQEQLIRACEQQVVAQRQRWLGRRHRRESLERVFRRYREEERVALERREQRSLDDRPAPRDLFGAE